MTINLTDREVKIILEYIDFMEEFDDDPTFREEAIKVRAKLLGLVVN